ncbi:MAG: acyl-CoA dehydrogenase [Arachnia propionica]|nr:MAG: acyl-CoA dehydrogenase [Arachnia propionica]
MHLLSDALLARIHDRAADYDASNTFCQADFDELAQAGYFTALVPTDMGGAGATLLQLAHAQQQLAAVAPATALAAMMHQVWVATALTMRARGETSGEVILQTAAAGEIFAFGISEANNDLVLFGSQSQAKPDADGGYRFYGTKIFTTASPAWTMLGTFATETTKDGPKSVYAMVRRSDGGVSVAEDWDTLGMRATQSYTTHLDGAYAPAEQVLARIDPGPTMAPVVFGIFVNFELLLASVYTGLAQRALDVAVQTVTERQSVKNQASYAVDPDIRWRLASAAIALEGIGPQIDSFARDIMELDDAKHGPKWLPRLSALKVRATETAKYVVEEALRSCGGRAFYNTHELSRLYRDVLAGLFQPSDDESAHAAWANVLLGPIPAPKQ